MSNMHQKNKEDFEWSGLFATGNLIGMILKASDPEQLQKNLDIDEANAIRLFNEQEGIKKQLYALKIAFDRITEKVGILEDVNNQLTRELEKRDKKITLLEKKYVKIMKESES